MAQKTVCEQCDKARPDKRPVGWYHLEIAQPHEPSETVTYEYADLCSKTCLRQYAARQ